MTNAAARGKKKSKGKIGKGIYLEQHFKGPIKACETAQFFLPVALLIIQEPPLDGQFS